MNTESLPKLKETYDNLTFFDNYGSSILALIFVTILLFLLVSLSYAYLEGSRLQANWEEVRCKPSVMPFAGLIMQPTNMSKSEFTSQNFQYCMQNNMKEVSGKALEPLTYITNSLSDMTADASNSLNAVRAMTSKVRNNIAAIFQDIYNRLVNFVIPLQEIIIKVRDSFGKIQGAMVTTVYTFLGAYFGLQSALGVIATAIVNVLIALAVIIVFLWTTPVTWGAAAAGTALFAAVAVPLGVMISFMENAFGVTVGTGNLKIPKCFDKDTLLELNDGSFMKVSEINPGCTLKHNNKVTSVIQVDAKGSDLYNLNGVVVSDTHLVWDKCSYTWKKVSEMREAIKIENYAEPYLYCFNTEKEVIEINCQIFSDWDESITKNKKSEERGFSPFTQVKLKNGCMVNMDKVKVGDTLENGEKVYGIVKMDSYNLTLFKFETDQKQNFIGTQNLKYGDSNFSLQVAENILDQGEEREKPTYLFHLLTDSGTFVANNVMFGDYNFLFDCIF